MPRCARETKSDAMYHIMIRSISEVLLFKENEDKETYLEVISIAKKKYYFNIYSFCLMDNHAHFILDPLGSNISKIMHFINSFYACYYNKKYHRIGPVFQGRFKSEIISSNQYFINASIYIHANPSDLPNYKNHIYDYPYSSLPDYINNTDRFGIINTSYLTKIFDLTHPDNYLNYISLCASSTKDEIACLQFNFIPEKYQYLSERHIILRTRTPKEIIEATAEHLGISPNRLYAKRHIKYIEFRALCCYLMVCFCEIPHKVIAVILGNITQSSISKLVTKGIDYIDAYPTLLNRLLL